MEKFSLEFKKVVSEKYLEGELSLKSVARMYGISPCTVRKWAYAYREHGISILTGKKGRYSAELKLTVVKEVVDDCFSVREVAVKHGIPAFGTVCNWLEKYRKYGEDAFIRKNKKSIPVLLSHLWLMLVVVVLKWRFYAAQKYCFYGEDEFVRKNKQSITVQVNSAS